MLPRWRYRPRMPACAGMTMLGFMDFIHILKERGFVHQFTDEEGLRELLKTPGQRAYIGFDCTAKSLHVGSLLQIMLLRWWEKCGHEAIVLLGGGTTKIGDPSGKDSARPPLTDAQIQENMDSLGTVFGTFLNKPVYVNNDEWLGKLNLASFLRDYGKLFSVNRMLTMDSVKLRLERDQPLSFLEFTYMIMQAYDFVELNRKHGCRVQMGGSDQWGNITQGIELNRRLMTQVKTSHDATVEDDVAAAYDEVALNADKYLFGITSPLITTSSGAKMGKTASGAVWLNADLCSPYDYWQFWRNTEDADVGKFLKLFTELSLDEIAHLEKLPGSQINDAKIRLATEATALLHGRDAADKAEQTARDTFAGAGVSDNLPVVMVKRAELEAGVPVYALVVQAGLAASNGEARRLIKGNGIKVNDAGTTEDARLSLADMTADGYIKLSAGKKRHVLIKAE